MRNILLAISIIGLAMLNAEEVPITNVEMETILEIPYGSKEFQLGTKPSSVRKAEKYLMDMTIIDNKYVISDYWNNRIVSYSRDEKSFNSLINDIQSFGQIDIDQQHILLTNKKLEKTTIINLKDPNDIIHIEEIVPTDYFYDTKLVDYGFTLIDNFLIGEHTKGFIILIDITPNPNNSYTLYENEDAVDYINSNSKDIKIGDDNRILYKDKFVTKDPKKFLNYYYDNNISADIISLQGNRFEYKANFSGTDKSMNTYWSTGAGIFIFNNNGKLIKQISIDSDSFFDSAMLTYAIDEDGNIYRLIKGDEKYLLKYIKSEW